MHLPLIHHSSFVFLLTIIVLVVSGLINYLRPGKAGIAPVIISIIAMAVGVCLAIGGLAWKLSHAGQSVSPVASGLIIHWLKIPGAAPMGKGTWLSLGMRTDTLGVTFFMVTLLIGLLGQIHLSASLRKTEPSAVYFAFSTWAIAALLVAFLAVNVLQLLTFILLAALFGWLMLMLSRDEPISGPGLLAAGPLLIPIGLAGASLALVTAGSAADGLHWLAGCAAWPKIAFTPRHSLLISSHLTSVDMAGILLAFGVLGFGAQVPFHLWPDEYSKSAASTSYLLMVSLILGAAPLLATRLAPFFTLDAKLFLCVCGAATSIMAALSSLGQTDIRRILASLTSSLAGIVMVLIASGGSADGLAIALIGLLSMTGLLMIAGTVIHAADRRTNITHMGGLWRQLPLSAFFALIIIAIITGTAHLGTSQAITLGFTHLHAYASDMGPWGMLLFWAPLAAVLVLSFSLARWWWLIFISAGAEPVMVSSRESASQTFPPLLLLIGGLLAGTSFLDLPALIHRSLSSARAAAAPAMAAGSSGQLIADFPMVGAAALALVVLLYWKGTTLVARLCRVPGLNLIHRWLQSNMYVSEMYRFLIARPIRGISILLAFVDRWIAGWVLVMIALGTGTMALFVSAVDGLWTARGWPVPARKMPAPDPAPVPTPNAGKPKA